MRKAIEQIKDKKDLVGAEIGVWRGQNAFEMLTDLSIKKLYLIDPYIPYQDTGNLFLNGNGEADQTKEQATKLLEPFAKIGKAVWFYETSVEAVKKVADQSLDFVYIDGNHQYEFVRDDINEWAKKVKDGGLVGGHDANLSEVSSAVIEYCDKHNYKPYTFEYKKDDDFWKAMANSSIGKKMDWRELKQLMQDNDQQFILPKDWWFFKEKQ